MKRPTVLVLLLTFVALVGVLLSVPTQTPPPWTELNRAWFWDVFAEEPEPTIQPAPSDAGKSVDEYFDEMVEHSQFHLVAAVEIRWMRWLLEFLVVLALGGLLVLALLIRERKRASHSHQ